MGFGAVRRQISTTLSGRSLGFRGPGGKGKSHLTGPVGRVGDWRPRIDREVEGLIIRMAEENRSWGYDRIVGALTNLGHEVSDQAVGNVLRRHSIPPAPERKRRTRIHSDPPRVVRRDGHFRGRGPYARIGDLLRAVSYIFGEL